MDNKPKRYNESLNRLAESIDLHDRDLYELVNLLEKAHLDGVSPMEAYYGTRRLSPEQAANSANNVAAFAVCSMLKSYDPETKEWRSSIE